MEEERKRTVVHRPEPPPDDDPPPRVPRAKLTPEEARALLAVTTVPKGPWAKVKPRLKIAFVGITVIGVLVRLALGWDATAAWVIDLVLLAAAIAWVVWPIVTAGNDDWS